MKRFATSVVTASLFLLPMVLRGQVGTPAPVSNTMPTNNFGFNLPTHLGTLSYSLSGAELFQTGFQGSSADFSTILSGNLAYLSKSQQDPFSLVYSGGYEFTTVPGSSQSNVFQDLSFSQVLRTRSWVYVISDAVSYLPGSPTTGLSGVAGAGDVGVFPVQTGLGPDQNILTNYGRRVSNGLQGSATWQTTPSLDLEGSGSWQTLDFLGSNNGDLNNGGLNSNAYEGTFGPSYRIDALNQIGAQVYYSRQSYPGFSNYKIESEGININYSRTWSRRFTTSFSAGPETTHGTTYAQIPGGLNFSGSASATYATRTTGLSASYVRSVNGGSGVIFGARSDLATVGMSRPINRNWTLGLDASFSRSVGLASADGVLPEAKTFYGGIQTSRRLTESLSVYGSYTAVDQSIQGQTATINAYNGLNHTVSVGITFAPAPLMNSR